MTYDPSLDDLMADQVTVRQPGGRNSYGEVSSAGSPLTYRARVVYGPRQIIGGNGEQVVSNGRAWVSGTVPSAISPTSILTLPNGSSPSILRVDTLTDEDGQHHQVVFF